MRWSAMLLSLILPGMGHTSIGRPLRGVAVTVLFTVGLTSTVARGAAVARPLLDTTFTALLLGTVLVYLLCQLLLLRVLIRASVSAARPAKEDHLRAGLAAAVRGDAERAEREFRRVLAIDPTDVEAHLNLGTVLAQSGNVRRARRFLKRCRRFDIDGKWDWEVEQELAALVRTNGNTSADKAAGESETSAE